MRAVSLFAALLTLGLSGGIAGCERPLPPEASRPLEAPPWADVATDSVLLDAACDAGTPQACRKLAVRFFQAGDEPLARLALTRGCRGASGEACWRWGAAFLRSDGVLEDRRLARTFFEAGCEGGAVNACRGLYAMLLDRKPYLPERPLREVRLTSSSRR